MSTRSFIAISNENGTIQGIYCHQNGSPRHNGQMLLNHYSSIEKLNKLFEKGSLSALAETPDTCVKTPNVKPVQETNLNSWAFDIQGDLDYIYIFTHDNFWLVFDCETGKTDLLESAVSQDICRYIPKLMADLAKDGYNNEVISRNCGAYGKVVSFDGSRLEIDILGQVFVLYPEQENPILVPFSDSFDTTAECSLTFYNITAAEWDIIDSVFGKTVGGLGIAQEKTTGDNYVFHGGLGVLVRKSTKAERTQKWQEIAYRYQV